MPESKRKGWAIPSNHPEGHYFLDGKSLCGRHTVPSGSRLYDTTHLLNEDCLDCADGLLRLYEGRRKQRKAVTNGIKP